MRRRRPLPPTLRPGPGNVIKTIRNARINLKTGLFILALALLMWAMVVYVRVRDFVPEEFEEPVETPVRTP